MPQNEAGKLRYRPQYCGAVARRKPRPTLVAMAGHCYRQMKDVVVNDKVHRGHSSELKDSSSSLMRSTVSRQFLASLRNALASIGPCRFEA
jgi:hypothetical protein